MINFSKTQEAIFMKLTLNDIKKITTGAVRIWEEDGAFCFSSMTENQLAAAIGTIAIILAFLLVGLISNLLPSSYWLRYVFDSVSIFTRFQTFANGYFDLSTVIYYVSMGGIFLYLTYRVYDRRRFG